MSSQPDLVAPQWTPRLRHGEVQHLYEQDAAGVVDEETINAFGTSLLERCESLVVADSAVRGSARCPQCSQAIAHDAKGDEQLECTGCSWAGTWQAYRQSLKGQNLRLGNLGPLVEDYLSSFCQCSSARERLIQIDFILHQFQSKNGSQGDRKSVV